MAEEKNLGLDEENDEWLGRMLSATKTIELGTNWMLSISEAFLKQYPPKDTNPDVIEAVTVPVPLRLFLAMTNASLGMAGTGRSFLGLPQSEVNIEEIMKVYDEWFKQHTNKEEK